MFAHPPPRLRMTPSTQRTRKALSLRERYLVTEDATAYRALATATYCAVLFLGGLAINILGAAGTMLTSNVNAKITAVGTIFTAEGVGNMLGSSLAGAVLDRYGGHSVLCALCLLMIGVVGAVPVCESISHVVALYFVVGGTMGMLSITVNTIVTWVQHGRNVGPWVNLLNSCFGLGATAAPLLFMAMERQVGNGLVSFSAIGLFASLPAAAAWLLQSPSQPVREAATEDEAASLKGLGQSGPRRSTIAGVDLGSRELYVRLTVLYPIMAVMTLVRRVPAPCARTRPRLACASSSPRAAAQVIGAEYGYTAWIYSYATKRVGMPKDEAALLNSSFWLAFTIGRMCMVPLAACFSPGMLLLPTLCLNVCSMLLILYNPASATCLWLGTVAAGVGVCALFSNAISLLAYYDLGTPSTTSAIGAAAATGHMTLPNLMGLAMQHSSWQYDALIGIAVLASATGLALTTAVVLHLMRNFTPAVTAESARGSARYRTRDVGLSDALESATNVL